MAEMTPMRKQYKEIKERYDDCLLFFRLGDFYEMFDEDACVASRELELALTTRDRNKPVEEQVPMCGVPYHSCEAYIGRLISKGYKVAICEQVSDPSEGKGIVERDVVKIITPGTVTDASMLDEGKSNYMSAIFLDGQKGAISFCDVSTGEFCLASFESEPLEHILNELSRFSPREAVLSEKAFENDILREFLRLRLNCVFEGGNVRFDYVNSAKNCCEIFNVSHVEKLGIGGNANAVCAAGALLSYLIDTQKTNLSNIRGIDFLSDESFMELDHSTRKNLELTENMRNGEKKDTLLSVLDMTKTPMGGRLMRSVINRPLISATAIKARLSAVSELYKSSILRSELRASMNEIGDMQRIIGRIVSGTAGGRELRALGNYLSPLPDIVMNLKDAKSSLLKKIKCTETLGDLYEIIDNAICENPPVSVREGGIMREGFDENLDYLRDVCKNGTSLLAELEARERERTGIKKLKVGYNKVFGYYIDVPRSAEQNNLPENYIRKQTLVSNERYFTEELKELENNLLTAKDKIGDLEFKFFSEIRDKILEAIERILAVADSVAMLDVLCSFAEVSVRNGYCEPEIDHSRVLTINEGRHPVVENAQNAGAFVSNDTHLGENEGRVAIITGPNMAGKSTYMRQTALIVLMAQIGCFVPAKSAVIGVIDRIFTRIGASDDLASGQSTFMVEMTETSNILKNATNKSLLVLDEIGRGTSTFDGMAIARAVLEYCADKKKLGAKTMFATHYHELSALEGTLDGVINLNISAKKQDGRLIFLRKILRGAADDSYGIEVAKLAGVPDSIIKNANKYLKELEASTAKAPVEIDEISPQISLIDVSETSIIKKLRSAVVEAMTPLEAMNLLFELKKEVDDSPC